MYSFFCYMPENERFSLKWDIGGIRAQWKIDILIVIAEDFGVQRKSNEALQYHSDKILQVHVVMVVIFHQNDAF